MLVKRYLPELGSAELEARLLAEQPRLIASELVKAEMISTLRRKERQGLLDRAFSNAAHAHFLDDLHRMAIGTVWLDSGCVQRATRLLQDLQAPLATLDEIGRASCRERVYSSV